MNEFVHWVQHLNSTPSTPLRATVRQNSQTLHKFGAGTAKVWLDLRYESRVNRLRQGLVAVVSTSL
ncbi:hypothetical protein BDR03DRAFT_962234, partial [Suillus americanus]